MSDEVDVAHGTTPFFWLPNEAAAILLSDVPEARRLKAMGVLGFVAFAASRARDGRHEGYVSSVKQLAAAVGESEATIYRITRELEAVGLLRRVARADQSGRSLPPLWIIGPFGEGVTSDTPVTGGTHADSPHTRARETKKKQQPSLSLPEDRKTRGRVKCQGKPVPQPLVEKAERLFADYCEVTGRRLSPYSATGKPSPSFQQVVLRVVEHPDVEPDEVAGKMRACVADPPGWVKPGEIVDVGDMFGPLAFGRLLARRAEKPSTGRSVAEILQEACA